MAYCKIAPGFDYPLNCIECPMNPREIPGKCTYLEKTLLKCCKMVQLTTTRQHWFWKWPSTELATNHLLGQWWFNLNTCADGLQPTVVSNGINGRHGVSSHRQFDCLFSTMFSKKTNILITDPLLRESHKRQVMRKAFPFHHEPHEFRMSLIILQKTDYAIYNCTRLTTERQLNISIINFLWNYNNNWTNLTMQNANASFKAIKWYVICKY